MSLQPCVYDTDLSLGNDLYYTHDYWDDFTKDTVGDTIRASYPIGEYTSVGLAYRLERYELYDVHSDASPYISDYKGVNWTSALSGRILRDTTDAKDRPTKGTITRLWAEYGGGGLGGTDNFVKAVADWQGFWSFNPQNTFHVRTRLGGVFQNTDDPVPVFERGRAGRHGHHPRLFLLRPFAPRLQVQWRADRRRPHGRAECGIYLGPSRRIWVSPWCPL